VFQNSLSSMRSPLDIFSKIPTDVPVLAADYMHIWPYTSIKRNNPVEIFVPPMNNADTDLYNSFVLIRCHITNANDTYITNIQLVALSNLFFHSLFESVQLLVTYVRSTCFTRN